MPFRPVDLPPIPKAGEPHYEEFQAVLSTLRNEVDMLAWMAVVVAYGKLSHVWISEPFELIRYSKNLDVENVLKFKIATMSADLETIMEGAPDAK